MPDKSPLTPDLFQFTAEELLLSNPELNSKLIPNHLRSAATTSASSAAATPSNSSNPPPLKSEGQAPPSSEN
jgi:hypothetical protein